MLGALCRVVDAVRRERQERGDGKVRQHKGEKRRTSHLGAPDPNIRTSVDRLAIVLRTRSKWMSPMRDA